MGLIHDRNCWKYKDKVNTFLQAVVLPFWREVLAILSEWVEQSSPHSPPVCLLGNKTVLSPGVSKAQFGLMINGFTTAARDTNC